MKGLLVTLSITAWASLCWVSLWWVSRFTYCYAECCYAKCRYAECRYSKWRSAQCRYAKCIYAECRGTVKTSNLTLRLSSTHFLKQNLLVSFQYHSLSLGVIIKFLLKYNIAGTYLKNYGHKNFILFVYHLFCKASKK
jgi:hypothetical protein